LLDESLTCLKVKALRLDELRVSKTEAVVQIY
jgi:hypothetical protein